jgi:hypothetical protein
MLRLIAVALVLVPAVALAQDIPLAAAKDMWCGTAFMLMTRDAPADATAGKIASVKVYADGADMLIQRALPIYLESGFTDAALASYREKLESSIDRIVNGAGPTNDDAAYSFQDCSALIGQ